jgi:hypothetical protein
MGTSKTIIIAIIILLLLFVLWFIFTHIETITGGMVAFTCEQRCKADFNSCNERCGSGWFSGLCKDGCTISYNQCLERCKQ